MVAVISNTSSAFIGNINPIRYRGYYYDVETGFYYLQTRYYGPTICRFINADNYELVAELSQTVGQLNLYAYANNNPIMLTDETGEGFFLTALLVGLIVGAVIGGTVAGVSAANSGETGWALAGSIAEGVLYGGLIGGMAGALIGIAPTIGAGIGAMMTGTAGAGATAALTSTYVVAAGATVALGLVLSEIPMHGSPNSFIQNGASFGEYDANGNLMYRTDTGHKHFIKKLQQAFQPHTHYFDWFQRNGIWRYIETVLPR